MRAQVFETEKGRATIAKGYYDNGLAKGSASSVPIHFTGHIAPVRRLVWSHDDRVLFSAGADLPRARMTCEQLLVELIGLAHDIAWQQRHGVEVAWDELQLRQTRGGPGHQLRLNDFGDTLLVTLPLLYSSPGLLPAAAPWLRSRVEGSGEVTLELGAADFGWE